jgi:broad specificity phosphatase PhoE
MSLQKTVLHLVRHGEVFNPAGVLYGRLPDYHLSDVGREMAERVAGNLAERDIVHLRCSPLERAQETMEPLAAALGLPVTLDDRLLEAENYLEGLKVSFPTTLRQPKNWRHFRNPMTPSWGEPYRAVAARMRAAMKDARDAAYGHEAVIVSHQLPIWMARIEAEGRRLIHDPRRRDCSLASITSFGYLDGRVSSVTYREPAADLLRGPAKKKSVAGT